MITIQFEARFVVRKRLEHLRSKGLRTVTVSTRGGGKLRAKLLLMHASMAADTELLFGICKFVDVFAALDVARLTGNVRVLAG